MLETGANYLAVIKVLGIGGGQLRGHAVLGRPDPRTVEAGVEAEDRVPAASGRGRGRAE